MKKKALIAVPILVVIFIVFLAFPRKQNNTEETALENSVVEATPTPAPTATPKPTATPEPTPKPTATPKPEPTIKPEPTPTPEPTATPESEHKDTETDILTNDSKITVTTSANSSGSAENTQNTGDSGSNGVSASDQAILDSLGATQSTGGWGNTINWGSGDYSSGEGIHAE